MSVPFALTGWLRGNCTRCAAWAQRSHDGHTFEVQPALRTPDGTKKPDYVFYRDQAALNANKNRTLDEALLHGKVFAVGDAKYREHLLDQNIKHTNTDRCRKTLDGRAE